MDNKDDLNSENNKKSKENNQNCRDNEVKSDKVKIVVSSLKEDGTNTNEKLISKNKKNSKSNKKINFFQTFYYSIIKLDKLYIAIEKYNSWVKYIFILLLILSVIMGSCLGHAMFLKTVDLQVKINELPELVYKDGKIKGEIDFSFLENNTDRLIIINTIDNIFDIREQYKAQIDEVEQYVLLTEDTIYAEPGESFKYVDFNFLLNKTINKTDIIEFLNILLELKFITYLSGFLASLLILSFITILAFFFGRFVITLLTINSIRTFDFKRINKLTIFLTTMPFIIYVILSILIQLNIFKLPINTLFIFFIIYLLYIIITLQILKKKYTKVKVITNIEDLTEILEDISEKSFEDIEKKEKNKREERKKLKDKEKQKREKNKKGKENKEQKDEIVEGA